MKRKQIAAAVLTLALAAANAVPALAAGWVHTPQGYKYQHGDGSDYRNTWLREKDQWYYFGDDGIMRTGWIQRDNTWYFASDTGELNEGIMKINGNVYKFSKGQLLPGNGSLRLSRNHLYFHRERHRGRRSLCLQ